MSFLAPLFLLGGLAIALPVVFHLVRRSSKEKINFSSLMFLKPTPPRMTRRNRLEHIFLLLLRCLALCVLALGFARPFFQRPMAATPANESGAQVVVLLDTSASMKRENLWSDAISKADAELKKLTPADHAAILTFDDQPHTIINFEQWNALNVSERGSIASQRLGEIKPSWRATHLGKALIAAADLLADAEKRERQLGSRRIVLISDLQEGSRLDGLQGYEWPRGVEVAMQPIKSKRTSNASLQWIPDTDDSANNADSSVRVRVSNSTDSTREQFQIHWAGIPNAPGLDAYVPPGQNRTIAAPKISENTSSDHLVLTGDDADFDNVAYVIHPKAEEVNVLYLGSDSETDSSQPLYYLMRAFQNTRRETVRVHIPGGAGIRAGDFRDQELAGRDAGAPSELATNRLIIATSSLSENQAAAREFLSTGGTVLLTLTDANSVQTLAALANAPQLTATEALVPNYAMFGQIDFTHPLFAAFADQRFSDFSKIRFWKHRKLSLEGLSNARVIARFDDTDPAIIEIPVGRGRMFAFAFSWRPADSQFALSSKFVPMLYAMLDQAGNGHSQVAQYRVGDSIDLSAFAKLSGAKVVIRKPNGSQVELASDQNQFTQTDEPGIYEIVHGGETNRFAVSLDPTESKTAPLPADELERLGVPVKPTETAVAKLAVQQKILRDGELESRQKLWRWLIVAALTVLLGETWLAGRITRRRLRAEAVA